MIPFRNLKRLFFKTLKQPKYALTVLFKRLWAYLYYLFANGRCNYPEAITLFLTFRCNLRCKMCGQWGDRGITKQQSAQHIKTELSFQELTKVIDEFAKFRPNMTLFGGEPLLHPDCLEIINYIKKKKMHCLIITNGSLLANFAEGIVKSGLDELNVSLDGGRELHDQIRGLPGLFDKIAEGLKQVYFLKRQMNKKMPLVNLQCTINRDNYKYLDQMLDVAKEVRADSLTFHNLIFTSHEIFNKQKEYDKLLNCSSADWQGFIFDSGIDPVLLYEKISAIFNNKYDFAVDFYPNFSKEALYEYYNNPNFIPQGYSGKCLSPWLVSYIFPDGETRPCLNSDYSFGNIKNVEFIQAWNSPKALRYRQLLKQNKIFPICVRCTELYRY